MGYRDSVSTCVLMMIRAVVEGSKVVVNVSYFCEHVDSSSVTEVNEPM